MNPLNYNKNDFDVRLTRTRSSFTLDIQGTDNKIKRIESDTSFNGLNSAWRRLSGVDNISPLNYLQARGLLAMTFNYVPEKFDPLP